MTYIVHGLELITIWYAVFFLLSTHASLAMWVLVWLDMVWFNIFYVSLRQPCILSTVF